MYIKWTRLLDLSGITKPQIKRNMHALYIMHLYLFGCCITQNMGKCVFQPFQLDRLPHHLIFRRNLTQKFFAFFILVDIGSSSYWTSVNG
jgi:hypothetical protein